MKESLVVLVALSIGLGCSSALQKPDEGGKKSTAPTAEQLQAAKEAFAKIGGKYFDIEKFPYFDMPGDTEDDDLKKIPNLPFSFGLDLSETKVTDAGMKQIAKLKNLTTLDLDFNKVRVWQNFLAHFE